MKWRLWNIEILRKSREEEDMMHEGKILKKTMDEIKVREDGSKKSTNQVVEISQKPWMKM